MAGRDAQFPETILGDFQQAHIRLLANDVLVLDNVILNDSISIFTKRFGDLPLGRLPLLPPQQDSIAD